MQKTKHLQYRPTLKLLTDPFMTERQFPKWQIRCAKPTVPLIIVHHKAWGFRPILISSYTFQVSVRLF